MKEEDEVLVLKGETTKDETWNTPDDNVFFRRTKMTMQLLSQARCVCVPRL